VAPRLLYLIERGCFGTRERTHQNVSTYRVTIYFLLSKRPKPSLHPVPHHRTTHLFGDDKTKTRRISVFSLVQSGDKKGRRNTFSTSPKPTHISRLVNAMSPC
jgi:hypothetical protein